MIRWHVISAVFGRNVKQYFTSVSGYLFIVVFVTVCALLAFDRQFFIDNLANLDQLNRYFPLLLLFLVPAITMGVWADERRQGTDAILFTLPASDLEILLGKYLSVVAVYTIALAFSVTQLIALRNIGQPDWGVVASTYLGYWLAGSSLLSVGMVASSLTRSNTVAFILGALFCSVPVLAGPYYRGVIGIERLGFEWQLRDFSIGLISLTGILYFVSLTVLMLYINLVAITRRHWSKDQSKQMGLQFFVRTLGLAAALVSLNFIADRVTLSLPTRLDLTRDGLYTLNPTTRATLNAAAENRHPITIQAFVSNDVPRDYVHVKNHFLGLLQQLQRVGGTNVELQINTLDSYSEAANEARTLGITPVNSTSEIEGRTIAQDVFLGAYVFSDFGDAVIPTVDAESSIEYELTRAIANTTNKKKKLSVGVLTTDLFFLGPVVRDEPVEWSFNTALKELRKTCQLKSVSAAELKQLVTPADSAASDSDSASKKPAPPDVMLVVGPSSLPQPALEDLVTYIRSGRPTLILLDPLPFHWTFISPNDLGVINAPREPRVGMRSMARPYLTEYNEEKAFGGTPIPLLSLLGIEWNNGRVAWHDIEPPPGFKPQWPRYLGETWPIYYGPQRACMEFVHNQGTYEPFNANNIISQGLRRLLLVYPGSIEPNQKATTTFTPLVQLANSAGQIDWKDLTFTPSDPQFPGSGRPFISEITGSEMVVIEPQPPLKTEGKPLTIAAQITGKPAIKPAPGGAESGTEKPATENPSINVVVIADTDLLSEVVAYQREALEAPLDNIKLVQNALEVLAGDSEFVRLRNRHPNPPSLTRFEALVETYRQARMKQQQAKELEIQTQLKQEQEKLDTAAKAISQDQELDLAGQLQQLTQTASEAQRSFDIKRQRLERELEQTVARIKADEQQNISRTENRVRYLSVALAPLPAILLGIIVLLHRFFKEKSQIRPERRV